MIFITNAASCSGVMYHGCVNPETRSRDTSRHYMRLRSVVNVYYRGCVTLHREDGRDTSRTTWIRVRK